MTFHSKSKITVVFQNPVTVEVTKAGNHVICYKGKADYNKLVFLVRLHYKIKSRKKRIVKKYIGKLVNDTLYKYFNDKGLL